MDLSQALHKTLHEGPLSRLEAGRLPVNWEHRDVLVFEHRFRLFRKEGDEAIFKEGTITSVPDDGRPIRYLDRLEVQPGGLEIWSNLIEVGGKPLIVHHIEALADAGGHRSLQPELDPPLATGAERWKTSVGTPNGGDVWVARSIDDLNGDGVQDVIAGSFDTNVYAMDGKNGTILWTFPTGYRVYSVYPIGDLTGDGVPEVAVGNQNLSGANNIVVHVLDGGAALTVFSDGFESGDTSAWSSTVP